MHKPDSIQENECTQFSRILKYKQIRKPDLVIINKEKKKRKKRTCYIVEFAILADHRVKIKENKKRD